MTHEILAEREAASGSSHLPWRNPGWQHVDGEDKKPGSGLQPQLEQARNVTPSDSGHAPGPINNRFPGCS